MGSVASTDVAGLWLLWQCEQLVDQFWPDYVVKQLSIPEDATSNTCVVSLGDAIKVTATQEIPRTKFTPCRQKKENSLESF